MNNQDNFIKSINFQEDYLPFKKDFEMYLSGGEKETQELIKYYLEKTGNKNYKKNSERFKINVILANNGGGKSRLLEAIKSDSIDLISLIGEEEKKSIFKGLNLKQYNVILDNLSPMSDNNYLSVNQNLLHGKGYGNFYLSLFNFLNNKEDGKEKYKLIEEYFNADLSADDGFILTINYSNKNIGVFSEIKEKIKNKYKGDEITNGEFDKFIDNLFYYEGFGGTITFYENTTPNLKELLRNANSQDDIFFYIYLITTGYLKELIDDRGEMGYADWATGIFDELGKEDEQLTFNNLINKKCGIKHKKGNKFSDNEIKKILKVVYEKVYKDNEGKFINIKTFNKDGKAEFADDEIKFFAKNFDINIKFKLKNGQYKFFSSLSGGEKSIIARFTNIYMNLLQSSHIKSNLILIDEPDLHLHLDWQRKYIKTLIYVFSTLLTDINLQFIIATHSPFIVSDLPSESIIILKNLEVVDIKDFKSKLGFGANYIDIIQNGFFFDNKSLMGEFSENIIGNIAESERGKLINGGEFETGEQYIKNSIVDEFLKNNLLYFKSKVYDSNKGK